MKDVVIKIFFVVSLLFIVSGCSTQYANQEVIGAYFPAVTGQSLEQESKQIPLELEGENILLLIGYKQASQFDIDRWLIGLDMTNTQVAAYELPTIQGWLPRLFSSRIDQGMRKGIPKDLWKGVITIYEDGERVQQFTGNTNPNNARVVLLGEKGKIKYFYDEGFSVAALNDLRAKL